jgi:hypothetical protein
MNLERRKTMAKKSWLKIISRLKKIDDEVGPIYPEGSTPIAGYAAGGPYHCEDCSFLKGQKAGDIFKAEDGSGRCNHPAMISDPKTKKDKNLTVVDIEHGCCAFNDQQKEEKESKEN